MHCMPTDVTVLGTCSLCGGHVVVPTMWMSVLPCRPTCQSCGATKADGPVIEMRRVPSSTSRDIVITWATRADAKADGAAEVDRDRLRRENTRIVPHGSRMLLDKAFKLA